MKKKKAVLAALIAAGMLTGCLGRGGGSILNTESSRIYVTAEGTLQTETVQTYTDQDYYHAEELEAYLEKTVSEYNGAHGQGAVTLDSCTLEKGTARMIYHYGSGNDLVGFVTEYEDTENQVDSIAVTPVADILGQIETEGTVFVKASDRKKADRKAVSEKGEYHAVVVETQKPVTIQTQGKIIYVSNNAVIKDRHTVETTQGKIYIIFK